jgi:predicted membrane channel-forming protein YqfA (hemolysin III family)
MDRTRRVILTYGLAIVASAIVVGLSLLEDSAPRWARALEFMLVAVTSVIAFSSIRSFIASPEKNVRRRHMLVLSLLTIQVAVYLLFLHT